MREEDYCPSVRKDLKLSSAFLPFADHDIVIGRDTWNPRIAGVEPTYGTGSLNKLRQAKNYIKAACATCPRVYIRVLSSTHLVLIENTICFVLKK